MKSDRAKVVVDGKVLTGDVVYKRYAPPNYDTVSVYSILLDYRKHDPKYRGTIFRGSEVEIIEKI